MLLLFTVLERACYSALNDDSCSLKKAIDITVAWNAELLEGAGAEAFPAVMRIDHISLMKSEWTGDGVRNTEIYRFIRDRALLICQDTDIYWLYISISGTLTSIHKWEV